MKRLLIAFALLMSTVTFLPASLFALSDPANQACEGANITDPGAGCDESGLRNLAGDIINILLFVIGLVAVIMIIIGGVRFVTSAGNEDAAKGARATILYAVLGLVVAIVAYALVNYVFDAFTG